MTHHLQILIVDDQPRARQSLRALLSTWPAAAEIREAADGHEAVRLVRERQPDIVLMDARMPGMDGLQATQRIKARWPQVAVVMLTMYGEYETTAWAAGVNAFVEKTEPADHLLAMLLAVAANKPYSRTPKRELDPDCTT
jgi:DNA-binding NarL/FixJ family response regulator